MRLRSSGTIALVGIVVAASLVRLALYAVMAHPFGGLDVALCHFDCDFYIRIAESGYGADAEFHGRGSYPHWAYFPLLPLAIRLITGITDLTPAAAGITVSTGAFGAFAAVGALYLGRTRGEARWWLPVLFAAPYGIFFSMPYTEALFAATAACVMLARDAKRPMLAAFFAALASAARPTGILLSALVAADQAVALWRRRHDRPRLAALADVLPPVAICALGLTTFMAWQYWQVGDVLAFSHVQTIWDRRWLGPITWLRLGLRMQDWAHVAALFDEQSYVFSASAAVLGLAVGAWLAARGRLAEAWVCAGAILLPLATGLHSLPRFVGTNPAFLFACSDAMTWLHRRSPVAGGTVLAAMAVLQLVLLIAWYRHAGGLF